MNFIFEEKIDKDICKNLINFFHNHPYCISKQHPGYTGNGIDNNAKKSTDVSIKLEDFSKFIDIENYLIHLKKVIEKYIKKFKYCDYYSSWAIMEGINIQWYKPGEGYYEWHTERISSQAPNNSRHLVFMTYLNTINEGGETEFFYQRKKIKPAIGKTLIWPADWTHTHRGIPSKTKNKYIITGWYNFL